MKSEKEREFKKESEKDSSEEETLENQNEIKKERI